MGSELLAASPTTVAAHAPSTCGKRRVAFRPGTWVATARHRCTNAAKSLTTLCADRDEKDLVESTPQAAGRNLRTRQGMGVWFQKREPPGTQLCNAHGRLAGCTENSQGIPRRRWQTVNVCLVLRFLPSVALFQQAEREGFKRRKPALSPALGWQNEKVSRNPQEHLRPGARSQRWDREFSLQDLPHGQARLPSPGAPFALSCDRVATRPPDRAFPSR